MLQPETSGFVAHDVGEGMYGEAEGGEEPGDLTLARGIGSREADDLSFVRNGGADSQFSSEVASSEGGASFSFCDESCAVALPTAAAGRLRGSF